MQMYQFSCGCRWPIIGPNPTEGALPFMDVDDNKLPFCPATWELMGKGLTKGVFQLESNLGRTWTKKLKPENAEHVGALGAILRPGCLKAMEEREGPDGRTIRMSATEIYCRRKNGLEPVSPYHPAVDPILAPTYGVLVYQEQSMMLAQAVAAFTLQEADQLRKAIGKKLPEEMAKCKLMFMAGAAKAGIITEDMAADLFAQIEKSQRYAFNKSHAMSYGLLGYDTAYIKAHFPVAFFANWLLYAGDKEEIAELVDDAKLFDVPVETPDVRDLEPHYYTDGIRVRFGLSDVSGVGDTQVTLIQTVVYEVEKTIGKPLASWSWEEFMFFCSHKIKCNVMSSLISVGAFRWTGRSRTRLLNEYGAWQRLTEKEQEWIRANCQPWHGLSAALKLVGKTKKEGGGCANKNRIAAVLGDAHLLNNPPACEKDTPNFIAAIEEKNLGIAITCSRVDSCDTSSVNCTCKDFIGGRSGYLVLGVEIKQSREVRTKKGKKPGQKMGFLTVSDGSCSLNDVTVFPDAWSKYAPLLREGNTVILEGGRDDGRDTLLVNHVYQI